MPYVSFADFWDGNRLKTFIDADDRMVIGNPSNTDPFESGKLIGFVVGVHESMSGILVCAPKNVSVAQLLDVVKKYVNENPDKRHKPAKELVMMSLIGAFPCN